MSNLSVTRFYKRYGLLTGSSPAQARSSQKNEETPLENRIHQFTKSLQKESFPYLSAESFTLHKDKIVQRYLSLVGEDFVQVYNSNTKEAFTQLTELSQTFLNSLPANIDSNLKLDIEDDIIGNIALTIIRIHGKNGPQQKDPSVNLSQLQGTSPLQGKVKTAASLFLNQKDPLKKALIRKQKKLIDVSYQKINSDHIHLLQRIQTFKNAEISENLLKKLSTYSGDTQELKNSLAAFQNEVDKLQAQITAYKTEEAYLNRLNPQAGRKAFDIASQPAIDHAKTTIEKAEKALWAYIYLRGYQRELSLPGCNRLHYYQQLDTLLQRVEQITDINVKALAEEIKQTKADDQPNLLNDVKEIFEKGSFPAHWEESFAQCCDSSSFTQDLTKIMIPNLSPAYITSFAKGIGVITDPHNNLEDTAKKAIEGLFLTACFQQGFFPEQAQTILARRNLEDIQALQLNQIVQTQSAVNPSYKENLENCLNSLDDMKVKTTLLSCCSCPKPGFFASLLLSILAFFSWLFRGCRRQDHALQE